LVELQIDRDGLQYPCWWPATPKFFGAERGKIDLMIKFKDLSIRLKLVVLLGASAAIALSISAVMSLTLTFVTQRDESLRHLQQVSKIAGENLTAALAFSDSTSADRMLGSLHADPQILAAIIHDDEARLFSAYVSSTAEQAAVKDYLLRLGRLAIEKRTQLFDQQEGLGSINIDYMFAITPIVFEGKTIGTLTIVSDNQALKKKLIYYFIMQSMISVMTLVIIGFISVRLQRAFTSPIFNIIDVIRKIAETKNYSVSVDAIQNDEFRVLYTNFNDMIAEIRDRDTLLSRLATTDPLTGLANRRYAMEVMQTMVSRARRKQEFFGLVSFDVDHFKRINDQFGHPVGDLVLKEVAGILAKTAREIDLVARIGGEEFLVLCDNSDVESTRMIAERMRMAIESAVIEYDEGRQLKMTVSAGVYASVPTSEDMDVALNCVDSALYQAKESGRNRVSIWEKT
jgi:diguanylate cyclase (GGDEF)-like protein